MHTIQLQQVLPHAFAGRANVGSDIWQCELTFSRGGSYLIEAASGTGKSSLCSYLYGYRHDYQGTISFDGEPIHTYSPLRWATLRREQLSLLFQDLRLFPELTSMENVLLKNRLTHRKSLTEIQQLFDELGIADKAHRKVGQLSYGQQQRVAFVRCLCQQFHFLILDEPVSHLDADNARRMAAIARREADAQGAGLIVTSIGQQLPLSYTHTLTL